MVSGQIIGYVASQALFLGLMVGIVVMGIVMLVFWLRIKRLENKIPKELKKKFNEGKKEKNKGQRRKPRPKRSGKTRTSRVKTSKSASRQVESNSSGRTGKNRKKVRRIVRRRSS